MVKIDVEFPQMGTVSRAKVIKITKDSFKVKLLPQKCPAVLPFEHLSDYPELREVWKLALSKGDFVQKVTPFNRNQNNTVSMKESFLSAAEQKSFVESFDGLKEGLVLPGVVKNHQDFGFFVELAGGHTGLCPATSIPGVEKSALKKHYPEGRSVLAYIKKMGNAKGRFLVSVARQDRCDQVKSLTGYLQSRNDALKTLAKKPGKWKNYCDVAVGSVVEVSVTSVKSNEVLCETLSGLQAAASNDHLGGVKPETGKKYSAVVIDVDVLSPRLQIAFDSKLGKTGKSPRKESPELKVGQTLKGALLLQKQQYLLMKLNSHGANKLLYTPATQHFNDPKNLPQHNVGMSSEVVIKGKFDDKFIGVLLGNKAEKGEVQVGDVVEALVKKICPLEMQIVTDDIQGRVHITELADDVKEGKNPLQNYKEEMKVKVKVIAKKMTTEKSSATAAPFLECSLKQSKMDKANPGELLREELLTSRGAKMVVFIKNVDSYKISVQASLMHLGSISLFNVSEDINVLNEISTHYKVGQALTATVIGKTHDDKILFSLIGKKERDPIVGMQVTAFIMKVNESKTLSLKLSNGLTGTAEIPEASSPLYSKGKYVKCEVLSVSKDGVYKLSLSRKRKAPVITEDTGNAKKAKKGLKREKQISISSDTDGNEKTEPAAKKRKASVEDESNNSNKKRSGKDRLAISGFAWGGDLNVLKTKKEVDDDDDDDDDEDDKAKSAKTDDKSRKKERQREEKMIYEYEKQQLKGNVGPHSVNDYERLVLQSPNSSMVWLGYMAYHLELGEVMKARTVAEKALDTINFREEQEKKNVWLAYLNLEVMYGDSEDLKKLLQRAITYNDPFDIQMKMCDIYIGAGKMEEAELQFEVLIRKFKKDKSVWKSYAHFLYSQNKEATARAVLKKCLTALEKKDHVEVITRFSCLEFSHGNAERGRTLFENLIASYPQRTDIWSVYVDIVIKSGDITGARQLLERAVQQKLNAKKISFLIKKFIRFEETHGTEDQVLKVKDMAVSLFQPER